MAYGGTIVGPKTQIERVLEAVRAGATTSYEVSAATGLSIVYCSSYLSELTSRGALKRISKDAIKLDKGRGRAFHIYALAPPPPPPPPPPVPEDKSWRFEHMQDLGPAPEREIAWIPKRSAPVISWQSSVFRPRYGPGIYRHMGAHWTSSDEGVFRRLVDLRAAQQIAADVLGRPPMSLISALEKFKLQKPEHWIGRKRVYVRVERRPLLSYPYITKARTDHSEVLAVNTLVAREYPEHMRADVCQDILLAMLEGDITIEKLKAKGIKLFVSQYRKKQGDPWGMVSLDAPRDDGRTWHELLSDSQFQDEWSLEELDDTA